VPLPNSLVDVGQRVAGYFARGGDPPYIVYVYRPEEEYSVRRNLNDLRFWLEAKGVQCRAISLAELFWQALEDAGWLGPLIEQERAAAGDQHALEELYGSVGEVLREEPTLPDRVVNAVEATGDGAAVFLYRAGSLYPAYRTSALLDDLRPRLHRPVTLLYPGRVVGTYGLSFMNKCEPAYGYRAHIIPREGSQ
jgi:hypothetical protein